MKQLIVVRHGEYNDLYQLNRFGREQVEVLGLELAQRLNGSKIILLSSTATRAKETSELLAHHLDIEGFTEHECLLSEGGAFRNGQEQEALKLIGTHADDFDVVILSTHMEFIDEFPTVWGDANGHSIRVGYNTRKGTARIIDTVTGEVEHLQPRR